MEGTHTLHLIRCKGSVKMSVWYEVVVIFFVCSEVNEEGCLTAAEGVLIM